MAGEQGGHLLEVRGISKGFPGVQALGDVSLTLGRGEILAVIGENGAGKSTLMKVLGGVHRPDRGAIAIDGREVAIDSVHAATAHGIALVHQELNNADSLDVASNIFLGREPLRHRRLGWIDRRRLHLDAAAVLARIGTRCSTRTLVRELAISAQQMVEIAKALSMNARILIMDEPTSSLSQRETEALFAVLREIRAQGVSVLYISHRLGEIEELADRVVALRDGRNSGELAREEISYGRMINLMIGRDLAKFYQREHVPGEAPRLEVRDLVVPARPRHPVSLAVRSGEIVVLAGLVGAGRTELLHCLFGIDRPLGGSVLLDGRPVTLRSPQDAIAAGLGLVPEDRKQNGLFLERAIEFNLTIAGLPRYRRAGLLRRDRCRAVTEEMVGRLGVRLRSIDQPAAALSGGNQQKVVLGKWLSLQPRVLLLDEPTRGIDVGAKVEIYRLMEALAAQGVAILVVSSEMQEVVGIADRVVVMREGKVTGELARRQEISEESIVQLATRAD